CVPVPSYYPTDPDPIRFAPDLPSAFTAPRCAVQPTPAIPVLAPSSSSSATKTTSLEYHLGRMVAGMASALGLALAERRAGFAISRTTKRRAGELLAELYQLSVRPKTF